MTEFKIKPETKKEYEEDTKKYFRNITAPKQAGKSAEDYHEVEKRLPSPEEKHKLLDRYTKGFTKTSRSGAFSKPNSGPAIFPSGLDFASSFIDEMTPKGIKPKEQPKPEIDKEAKPTGGFLPKARAIIVDTCLDCMKEPTKDDWVLGLHIIIETDALKLWAMKCKLGDVVLNCECKKCYDYAQVQGTLETPLALVFGKLFTEEDIRIANRTGFQLPNVHDGTEKTLGQWNMVKRRARLEENLVNYLIACPADSKVFRDVTQRSQDGNGYDKDIVADSRN
jgi:hypothetical protein